MDQKPIFKYPDFRVTLLPTRQPDGLFWFLMDRPLDKTPGKLSSDAMLEWLSDEFFGDGNWKLNIRHSLIDRGTVIVYDRTLKNLWYRTNAEHVDDIWPAHTDNFVPALNAANGLYRNTTIFHDPDTDYVGIGSDGPTTLVTLDGTVAQTIRMDYNPEEYSEGHDLIIRAGAPTINMVQDITLIDDGAGYLPGDYIYLPRPPGGHQCVLEVYSISATGGLSTVTLASGGSNYSNGTHILTVVQGGASGGQIAVTASGGAITSIHSIRAIGTGYAVANSLSTTGGDGSGCTINITETNGSVVELTFVDQGSRYSLAQYSTTSNSTWGAGVVVNASILWNATDKIGGNLKLYSGQTTGEGTSEIQFWTTPTHTAGRTLYEPEQRMVLNSEGYLGINLYNPLSYLDVEGSHGRSIITKSDITLNIDETYHTILLDASDNNVTVTLPNAAVCERRVYTLVAVDITNTVKFVSAGGNINDVSAATGITFEVEYQTYSVQSDGTQWWITSTSVPDGCYWKRDPINEYLYPRNANDYVLIPTYLVVGSDDHSWGGTTKISIQESSNLSFQGLGIYMEALSHGIIQNTFYGTNTLIETGSSANQIAELTAHKTVIDNTSSALTSTMRGSIITLNADAEVTNVFGADYEFDFADTIDNFIGLRIQEPTGTGILTNKTALYIGDYAEASEGVTTAWSIYAAGGNSYFKDRIGVGLTPITHEDVLSVLDVEGSIGNSISTLTATTTDLDDTHYTILVDATSNNVTVWLPDATLTTRRRIRVKLIGTTTGRLIRVKSRGGNIDNISASVGLQLDDLYEAYEFHSDGTQWWLVSMYAGDKIKAFKTISLVVPPALWPDPQPLYNDTSFEADNYKDTMWLEEGNAAIDIALDADHDIVKLSLVYQNSDNIDLTIPDGNGLKAIIDVAGQTSQDLLYFNGTIWTRFPKSTVNGYILSTNGSGNLEWVATSSSYTDEMAQDAVGTILTDSYNIDFSYVDATPSITAVIGISGQTDCDLLYYNGSHGGGGQGYWDRFAANTTATVKYLSSVSGHISWVTVSTSDTYGYWSADADSGGPKNISSNELVDWDGINGIVTAISGTTSPYTITIGHSTTGGTSISSDNSNGTVIQDLTVTIDSWGHVTTASAVTYDLDNRYYTETESDGRYLAFRTISVVTDVGFSWGTSDVVADTYNDTLKLVSTNSNLVIETDATNDAIRFTVAVGNHNLLSSTHSDTVANSAVSGDIIYANGSNLWTRLPKSTDGKYLKLVSGFPSWETIPAGATYTISAETATGGAYLRLTGSNSTTDDVKFASGTQILVSRTDDSTINITTNFSGTENYLVRFVDDTPTMMLGNSIIQDNGTTAGIGALSSGAIFYVTTSTTQAIVGNTSAVNGTAILGSVTATTGNNVGVYGSAQGLGATVNTGVYAMVSGGVTNYGFYTAINSDSSTTTYGVYSEVNGSATTNTAIYASAILGTNNYALHIGSGKLKIDSLTNKGSSSYTGVLVRDSSNIVYYRTAAEVVADAGGIIGTITLLGDVTGSGTTSITTTIANDAVEYNMLNDNVISGQTELTSGLSGTDELLISDAGVIKRMDINVLKEILQPLDADLTAIAALTGTYGLLRKTNENTWTIDTATYLTTVTSHKLLSTYHSDTVGADPILGDLIYGNSTSKWTVLSGNTSTTKKFLTQTGTGTASAVPAWGTIVAADLPTHSLISYHSANNWKIFASNGSGQVVEIDNVGTGYYLASAGTTSLPYWNTFPTSLPPGAHTLGSHSDVVISGIASGEILKWSGTAWINNTLVEASIIPASGIALSTGSAWNTSITTSAGLAGALSDETGYSSGAYVVFSKNPTLDGATISTTNKIYFYGGTYGSIGCTASTQLSIDWIGGTGSSIYLQSGEINFTTSGSSQLMLSGSEVFLNSGCPLILRTSGLTVSAKIDGSTGWLELKEVSTPSSDLDASRSRIFVNTNGDICYMKNGSSTVYVLGTGTVTSVAMTVPTGLTISGSPITSSGTLAVSLQSGYSIPTTANQTNWSTAYSWGNHALGGYIVGPASSTDRGIVTYNGSGGELAYNNSIVITSSGDLGIPSKKIYFDYSSNNHYIEAYGGSFKFATQSSGYFQFVHGSSYMAEITTSNLRVYTPEITLTNGSVDYIALYYSSGIGYLEINRSYLWNLNIQDTTGSKSALFDTQGHVLLYYSNGERLETTSSGVTITGALYATGNISAYSDMYLKENIITLDQSLEKVMKMRPVAFNYLKQSKENIGFIAQEIQAVEPRLVNEDKGYLTLAYGNISALLTGAIQELTERIKQLEEKLS